MAGATTNFEKLIDTEAQTDGLQLPNTFEDTFKTFENRNKLVSAATEKFAGLEKESKDKIIDQATKEIASWSTFPKKGEADYNAKIAVGYLYTTLNNPKMIGTLDDVKKIYDEIKEGQKKEAEEEIKSENPENINSKNNLEGAIDAEKGTNTTKEEIEETPEIKSEAQVNAEKIQGLVNEKTTEQKEATENIITYSQNKDGKRGYEENITEGIDLNIPNKGMSGLSNTTLDTNFSMEKKVFTVDNTVNDFMNKDKDGEKLFSNNNETFNFIAKNYPSLSKNEKINKEINTSLVNYIEGKNENIKFKNNNKDELTGIKLDINSTTGEYYFNIPAEGNLKNRNKGVESIDIYGKENIVINNKKIENNTTKSPEVNATTNATLNTTEAITTLPNIFDNIKNLGTWTKEGDTYTLTPTTKKTYTEFNATDGGTQVFNLENDFDVKYFSDGGNISGPITQITIGQKKGKKVENNTPIANEVTETKKSQRETRREIRKEKKLENENTTPEVDTTGENLVTNNTVTETNTPSVVENTSGTGATITNFSTDKAFSITKADADVKLRVAKKTNKTSVSEGTDYTIKTRTTNQLPNKKYQTTIDVELTKPKIT